MSDVDGKIEVTAEAFYLPQRSAPEQGYYFFAYRIRIRNAGEAPAQLLERHWIITDAAGQVQEVHGPGVVGEVAAGGPNIMKGYVSGDERELGKIDDQGRLRTGDLGRLDEDGHLFLVGRSSEMIKSAGERIFPQEIEDVLHRHPAVQEVAVIGLPDEILGERVVAYIIPHDGQQPTRAELKAHCLEAMPFVRVPKEFVLVSELPQTASGKVSRSKLKAQVLAAQEQD